MRYRLLLAASVLVLLGAVLWSLSEGRFPIPARQIPGMLASRVLPVDPTWTPAQFGLLETIRLPRVLASVLVGAALSLSGATFQGIFRNPLVSPDLLGVSQGASVGAASAILLGAAASGIGLSALVGGLLAVLLATTIPRILRNDSTLMLVLSGVVVAGLTNALIGVLKFVADPETQLASITYWQMGSLADVRAPGVAQAAWLAVPCAVGLLLLRWRVNVLSLGDADAKSLGMNLRRTRGLAVLLATVLTASSVCIAGTVSWIGLVVPHLCRLLVGPDNAKVLPISLVLGGAFMALADTLARSVSQAEVPLSVVTGLVGVPLYLILLVIGRVRVR